MSALEKLKEECKKLESAFYYELSVEEADTGYLLQIKEMVRFNTFRINFVISDDTINLTAHGWSSLSLVALVLDICTLGCVQLLRLLLSSGIDVQQDYNIYLRRATRRNQFEIVKLLVEAGADVHADCDEPLRTAVRENYFEIAYFLLERGADVNQINWHHYDRSIGCDEERDLLYFALNNGARYNCSCLYPCKASSSVKRYYRELLTPLLLSPAFDEYLYDYRIWITVREYLF